MRIPKCHLTIEIELLNLTLSQHSDKLLKEKSTYLQLYIINRTFEGIYFLNKH